MSDMIDNNNVYSYKGHTIHQTRNKNGDLQDEIVIKKNDEIVKRIDMAKNITIKGVIGLVENIIDNI